MTMRTTTQHAATPVARAAGAGGKAAALGGLALLLPSLPALAQSALPGSVVTLPPITVEAQRISLAEELRARFEAVPGGANVIMRQDLPETANLTVSRALREVPGVVVQDFFGANDQPRIQIRGSGLQQNPVERGVIVMQDGLPLNRADGSYIVGFANPNQAEAIEVYRGYTANRLGASVLGGALNFVSPTGSSMPGSRLSLLGGSFGTFGLSGASGFAGQGWDATLRVDYNRRDGYREYNASERISVGGNVGYVVNDDVRTRLFFGYTRLGFEVAGPLSQAQMDADPRQVSRGPTVTATGATLNPGPNVVRDRPRRDAEQYLIGSRTTAIYGSHRIDGVIGYTYTDDTFRFPISSGVRSTVGGDVTALLRYAYQPGEGVLPLFESTGQMTAGSAERRYSVNQGGHTGALFGANSLNATTLSMFSGFNVPLPAAFFLSPSLSYTYATRDNADNWSAARRLTIAYNPRAPYVLLPNGAVAAGNTSYGRTYDGWTPAVALSYRPVTTQTAFLALSTSFEPPTHDDLLAPVNGTPNSSAGRPNPAQPGLASTAFATPALQAQTATTLEAGWRGRYERVSWDAVVYYSWVYNELLSLRDSSGAPLASQNADRTRHFGIELAAGARITERVMARIAYTYQDFRFQNDPVRGNNLLGGAPRHVIDAQLAVQATDALRLSGGVRWLAARTPVDNMNTLWAQPYAVLDLRADYRINERFSVYGTVTNVFDKTYAASTLVVDQASPGQAVFLPGDGRAFYAGVTTRF